MQIYQNGKNTLVGYVLGEKPNFFHLKACVTGLLKPSCSLDIHTRENGCYLSRFGTKDESQRVLQTGPWLFDGRLIILKQWSQDIRLERNLLTSIPVWVRFPVLHLNFWSQNIISNIASLVGTPLFMDKATSSFEKLAFARCFIEINVAKPLAKTVALEVEGREKVIIEVEYEWIPPTCTKCKCFGHEDLQCPTKTV